MSSPFKLILVSPTDIQLRDSELGRPKPHLPKLSLATLYEWLTAYYQSALDVHIVEQAAYDIDWSQMRKVLEDTRPNAVGITSATFNILGAYKLAEIVKEIHPNCPTILGGAHATTLPVENMGSHLKY